MRKNITFHLYLFLFVFMSGVQSFAQSNYKVQSYKYTDGLPSDNILSIDKKDGFLYVGTQRGLSLFDGYRFLNQKFLTEPITSLFLKNNVQYLSSGSRGICSLSNFYNQPKVITKVNFNDDNTNNDHYDNLFIDNKNRIWCSDQNNLKFFSSNGNGNWKIDESGNLSENKLHFFQVENEVWAATPKGVFVWNEKLKTLQKHSNPVLANNAFASGFSVSENEIFLTNFSGELFRFEPQKGKISLLKSIQNLPLYLVKYFSGNDNFLLIYNKNEIYKYDKKLNKSELIFSSKNEINTVFYDKETRIIWAGTNRGLQKIVSNAESIENIHFSRKYNQTITTIAEDKNHNLWMTNNTSEIYCLKSDKSIEVFHSVSPKIVFTNVFIDDEVFISASDGVYIVQNNEIKKVISSPFPVKKVIKDNKNQLWVLSSKNGIKVFDSNTFKENKNAIQNSESYWKTNTSNDISVAKDGIIWLASWMPKDYGISFFDEKQHLFKEINSLKSFKNESKFITDYYNRIALTINQNILFSGYGGWNLVSPKGEILRSFFTSEYKIANDHIEGIAEDSLGNIWFACAEGLYQYNFATDKAIRISQLDGLENNDLTFGFHKFNDNSIRKNDTLKTIDNHQRLFEIGSVTKLFTATILAQLVLEKKLKLEDKVNRFYNFPFKNDIKLSFGSLANHSSGLYRIPKNLEENIEENNPYKNYAADKLEDYLQNSLILENASGKNYGYSNLAFGLLGFTMAKEEKTTFQKLLQKRVFDKFGMNNSFTNVAFAEKSGKLIKGLDKDGKETSQWDFDALSGCGSAVSSVQDLARFSLAQFNSGNKDLQLMQIPTFTKDQKTKVGLAWHIYQDDSQRKLLWHNGGTGGYSSSLLLNPKTKNGVAVLSNVAPGNLDHGNIEKIAFEILKVLDVRK